MFETWLLISGILCYVIFAFMLSPSLRQLNQEHNDAKQMYLNRGGLIGKAGMLINNLHFKIVNARTTIIIYIRGFKYEVQCLT